MKLLTHVITSPVAIRLAVDLAKDYQIKDGKAWTIKMVIEKDRKFQNTELKTIPGTNYDIFKVLL